MTDAPRVLHLIDTLSPGGAQAILKTYLEAGTPLSGGQWLYALRTTDHALPIRHPNIVVDPSPSRISAAPLFRIRRLVERERIGILHCHLMRSQVFGYLLKRLHLPHVALVFHEHGRVVGREGESRAEAIGFRAFLRVASPYVTRFLCAGDFVCSRLVEIAPDVATRAVALDNPVQGPSAGPSEAETVRARARLAVPSGRFVLGFAGRLVDRKGWRDFLHGVKVLARDVPLFFLMAGDGPDRSQLVKTIQDLGLGDEGVMLGQVHDMRDFYQALDCLIMPSHWEPHGLSHIEAQSHGVPVVVADVPGLNATVHACQDALLFPAGDVEHLVACVRRVHADAGLRRRLQAAGLRNAARFSVEAFSTGLEALYASMAESNDASPARGRIG
jgi:glycosyltransferase involved in cell wall biosynthesis